jgi:LmbE family N-acetylglucosaminyl deacetylase
MNVMIIVPHPDDEILGFGGVIQRHVAAGDVVQVHYLSYSYELRQKTQFQQTAVAAQKFGFTAHIYQTELIDRTLLDCVVYLEKAIQEFKPDILYTVFPGDNHQDHEFLFKVIRIAARPLMKFLVKKIYLGEILSSTDQAPRLPQHAFIPNYYVGLTKEQMDKKLQGLEAYPEELREWPHPRSAKGVTVLAEKRGSECCQFYAEAFMVLRDIQGAGV